MSNFASLEAWQHAAQRAGLKTRLVSRSKTNDYWQALHPQGGVVGFFNTGHQAGHLKATYLDPKEETP